MASDRPQSNLEQRLIQLGVLLFLLGLLTGIVLPKFASPRMGLTAHLEGVMNGTFLIVLGLIWSRLRLSNTLLVIAFWLGIYGTFANWLGTLLGGIWGAGGMMPIAGGGSHGTQMQEATVTFLLLSLTVAMVLLCIILLWGLRRKDGEAA